MPKKRWDLRIDADLAAKADAHAARRGETRTALVEHCLRTMLGMRPRKDTKRKRS